RSAEAGWRDASNGERPSVEDDRFTDRARPSAKPALPEPIAQDRDRSSLSARAGRHIVLGPNRRPDRGGNAEHTEIAARNEHTGDALGRSAGRKAPGSGPERQHTVERGGVVLVASIEVSSRSDTTPPALDGGKAESVYARGRHLDNIPCMVRSRVNLVVTLFVLMGLRAPAIVGQDNPAAVHASRVVNLLR